MTLDFDDAGNLTFGPTDGEFNSVILRKYNEVKNTAVPLTKKDSSIDGKNGETIIMNRSLQSETIKFGSQKSVCIGQSLLSSPNGIIIFSPDVQISGCFYRKCPLS